MAFKPLQDIHRGDRIVSPKGPVTVTSFSHNWAEDFRSKDARAVNTVTVVGTLPTGKQVSLTAAASTTVEVAE